MNVVTGATCSQLTLSDTGANFYIPGSITATNASYTKTINGSDVLVLPFEATLPTGVEAYSMQYADNAVVCTRIQGKLLSANTPVLVTGTGTFTFAGAGSVSSPHGSKLNNMALIYLAQKAPVGSYVLKTVAGVTAFYQVSSGAEPTVPSFSAYFSPAVSNQAATIPVIFNGLNDVTPVSADAKIIDDKVYDLLGRRVYNLKKDAIYIQSGKKLKPTVDMDYRSIIFIFFFFE